MCGPWHVSVGGASWPLPIGASCLYWHGKKCVPTPRIRDVFSGWGCWPPHQEIQLQLSVEELTKYLDPRYGRDKRLIEMHDVCPTTLHSYSNALEPCPCGCRTSAFSEASLSQRGLRGFCVHSSHTNQPRFLHPLEHAALLGVPLTMDFSAELREANSLLGLVASPIQGAWIFAQLIQGAAKAISNLAFIQPTKVLEAYKQEITRQVKTFINDEETGPFLFTIDSNEGATLRLMSPTTSTIANLVDAERISLGWGDFARVGEGGLLLPGELRLVEAARAPISLEHRTKRQRALTPVGRIVIAIVHLDRFLVEMINAGDFMFTALHKLGIYNVSWLIDEDGKVYGSDLKVWSSMRLYTMCLSASRTFALCWSRLISVLLVMSSSSRRASASPCSFKPCNHWPPLVPHTPLEHLWFFDLGGLRMVIHLLGAGLGCWIAGINPMAKFSGQLPMKRIGSFFMANKKLMDFIGLFSMDFGRLILVLFTRASLFYLSFWGRSLYVCDQCDGFINVTLSPAERWLLPTCARSWEWSVSFRRWPSTSCTSGFEHMMLSRIELQVEDNRRPSTNWPTFFFPKEYQRTSAQNVPMRLFTLWVLLLFRKPWDHAIRGKYSKPRHPSPTRCSSLSRPMSWVTILPSELMNVMALKIVQRSKGVNPPNPSAPLHCALTLLWCSSSMELSEDSMGNEIFQLPIEKVVPDATGIAVCDHHQAAPYLDSSKNLSCEPLALLIINEMSTNDLGYSSATSIQFPAHFAATKEPMLLSGMLVQLGDTDICRVQPTGAMKDEEILDTSVLKIVIYRDEIQDQWREMVNAPIRFLVQMIPKFQLCRAFNCTDCKFFHAPVEESSSSVIHEVWGRRFQGSNSQVTKPEQATQYQAFLRVSQSALMEIISVSVPGIYLEPRSQDTNGSSSAFSVIWIQDTSRDEALHRLKMTAGGLSLARFRSRFGVRVLAVNEEKAHRLLKPDMDYVKLQIQQVWKAHPLPFGLQKSSMQRVLKEWKWEAKALQPLKGSAHGGSWEIGSSAPPPATVLQAFNQDVLLTLIRDRSQVKEDKPVVVPRKTIKFLKDNPGSEPSSKQSPPQDPWLLSDPWAKFTGTAANTHVAGAAPRLEEVKKQLKTDVQDFVHKELASSSTSLGEAQQAANARRFEALETDMKEMKSHNQKVTAWFQEANSRMTSSEQQMQVMASALENQQKDLHAVRSEVQQSFETTQSSVQSALHHMKHELATDLGTTLQDRLDKFSTSFEAMMAKKSRTEWLFQRGSPRRLGGSPLSTFKSLSGCFLRWIWCLLILVGGASGIHLAPTRSSSPTFEPWAFGLQQDVPMGDSALFHAVTWRIGEARHPGPLDFGHRGPGLLPCSLWLLQSDCASSEGDWGSGPWSWGLVLFWNSTLSSDSPNMCLPASTFGLPTTSFLTSPTWCGCGFSHFFNLGWDMEWSSCHLGLQGTSNPPSLATWTFWKWSHLCLKTHDWATPFFGGCHLWVSSWSNLPCCTCSEPMYPGLSLQRNPDRPQRSSHHYGGLQYGIPWLSGFWSVA